MHKKLLVIVPFVATVAGAAMLAPRAHLPAAPLAALAQASSQTSHALIPPAPSYTPVPSGVTAALEQWNSLRQSDHNPFSAYALFLTRYRGWPGETGLRKAAERAIDPASTVPRQVVDYFRQLPPLTPGGQARYAYALLATGDIETARSTARAAWTAGSMPQADETRLLTFFGSALTPDDHDRRMEHLLSDGDTAAALRMLGMVSAARRPLYDVRLALQTRAPDAAARLALLGTAGDGDPGLLLDRAKWLRDTSQNLTARALLAQPHNLTRLPVDPEKWFETLLAFAQGAAADRQWQTAYKIASQVDDAYPAGTDVSAQPLGERDAYTSLTWLAGMTALNRLNRPTDAATMFVRYAHGGRSAQVLTKGLYWAGRAATAAGQPGQAEAYFSEAAGFPELFYSQLALERLARPIPPPQPVSSIAAPTSIDRSAFQQKDLVQAIRMLGLQSRWDDQSLFVRALAEQVEGDGDRVLAADLSYQIGRPDLAVWLERDARNDGAIFYARTAYPQVTIPATGSSFWSLAHGIIRQESSFDRAAVSHAGARGMMQLMAPTARGLAAKLNVSYDLGRLTRDPDFNVLLGTQYFGELMAYWGNYAPLAVASYNAGTANVRRWIAANGDPRTGDVDVIRWIEEIPFPETRGYVQRVLENAVVYDAMNPQRARSQDNVRLSFYLGKTGRPG